MSLSLKDRINSYQLVADYKLISKLPIVITINGKNFNKITSLLEKPYDAKLAECWCSTILRLASEIEGTLFAYYFNDEMVILVTNSQQEQTQPWLDNKIQKIASIASSIASVHFNQCANAIDLSLMGDAFFYSQIFAVPNLTEAINTIIYKQQANFFLSTQFACLYELLNKYDKNVIKEMLSGLTIDEKQHLLLQEVGKDFAHYPLLFRRGAAVYRVPQIENNIMKKKWFINYDLPVFTQEQSFLKGVIV